MNGVSLFAGVGGFDLAMERNGINVVATVEIDKAARGVLQHRFPNSTHFTDITEVTGEQLRDAGFVPERGVITGGFPCQDVSVAGNRAGLSGSRTGLFWEIVRLLDELRPKYFILENVPGLLSSNDGRDFGTVLGALVDSGYGVAYRILDAQYFGVPQRRRRVFIVGCRGDDGRTPAQILALAQGVSGDSAPSRETGQEVAGTLTRGFGDRGVDANAASENQLVIRAVSHGEYVEDSCFSTLRSRDHKQGTVDLIAHTLTAEYDASEDGSGRGIPLIAQTLTAGTSSKGVSAPGRRQEDDANLVPFVKIIRSGARDENGELPPEVWAERDISPILNVMDNTGDSRATVLVSFAQNQRGELRESPVAAQLTAGGGKPGEGYPAIREEAAVRRLTPMECERLQGFPDNWTEGQSDSARYRQMGNAVAVPVVEWIFRNLKKLEPRE